MMPTRTPATVFVALLPAVLLAMATACTGGEQCSQGATTFDAPAGAYVISAYTCR